MHVFDFTLICSHVHCQWTELEMRVKYMRGSRKLQQGVGPDYVFVFTNVSVRTSLEKQLEPWVSRGCAGGGGGRARTSISNLKFSRFAEMIVTYCI